MADDEDEAVDIESIFPWMNDSDEAGEITQQTVANAALGGLLGAAALVGDVLDDDDEALLTPEGAVEAVRGLRGDLVGLLDDDDEQSTEEEPSGTESGLFSLIDKAGQALDDVGSRLKGAVDDFAAGDADGDGLNVAEEFLLGTNPWDKDTDGDKLDDLVEIARGTNPRVKDTDKDGLDDGYEVDRTHTDPLKPDTDGDGVHDGVEYAAGTLEPQEPGVSFRLPDGGPTLQERLDSRFKARRSGGADDSAADVPAEAADDGSGETGEPVVVQQSTSDSLTGSVTDAVEPVAGLPESDPDDDDGLTVREKLKFETEAWNTDTDSDGLEDGLEVEMGLDPMNWDSDGDGLGDGIEVRRSSNPNNPDSDFDGVGDGLEFIAGTLGQGEFGELDEEFGELDEPTLARAAEVAGDLAETMIDGATAAPVVAQPLLADMGSGIAEIADGAVADIVMGLAPAEPGQNEQEQLEGRGTVAQPVLSEPVESSTPATEDKATAASDAEVEVPALPQILEVSDPIEVEVPVDAVLVEQPQVEIPEPELLQDRVEDIDESVDSLTDFDDPGD